MTFSSISFSNEPALYVALANAVLLVLVNFGIPISGDQKTAIDTLLGALLAVVAGVVIRSRVTPVTNEPVSNAPVANTPVNSAPNVS